ncbi:MAG: ABC transporter substrate-binding protein [Chloroflexi bacterium]|nr:ABC transporter substrate-binding protein [Chloroflexota bacterium]
MAEARRRWSAFAGSVMLAAALAACSSGAPAGGTAGGGASSGGTEPAKPGEAAKPAAAMKPLMEQTPDELVKNFPAKRPQKAYSDSEIKKGGTLRIATSWDTSTLDPTTTASGGTIAIVNMVYSRVLKFKTGPEANLTSLEIVPELATSWEVSSDGLVYTFKLRQGVKWANQPPLNGREFTSDDIKYNWERYAAEGVHQSYYKPIAKIETPDKYTIKATMKEANPGFLPYIASQYAPIHPKELVEDRTIKDRAFGTGPWLIDQNLKSEKVTYKKNPDYFVTGRPYLDRTEHIIMPDLNSRLAAYRSKQVEYAYSVVNSLRETDDLMRSNPETALGVLPPLSAGFSLSMRVDKPPFNDVRVRRAIGMALDQQRIIDTAFNGAGYIGLNFPWNYALDKRPNVKDLGPYFQYNPEESKKLLKEAGVPNLTANMIMYDYGLGLKDISELSADMLKQVGVTLKIQNIDYTSFNSQWVGRKFEEMALGWGTVSFDEDGYVYNQLYSQSPGNRWFINDPVLDDLVMKQRVERDATKRRALIKQIWDREMDQMWRVNVPTGYSFDVQQPYVRNMRWGNYLSYYYAWGMYDDIWLDK